MFFHRLFRATCAPLTAALLLGAALPACSSSPPAQHTQAVVTASSTTSPAPPKRDIVAAFHAIFVYGGRIECLARGARLHIAVIATSRDSGGGNFQPMCYREVRAGDSEYSTAGPIVIFAPSHDVGEDLNTTTQMVHSANDASCSTSGRKHRLLTARIVEHDMMGRPAVLCFVAISANSSDSAADTAPTYTFQIPARDLK